MTIRLKGEWESRRVWLDGKELSPEKSQKVRNHSPDGFAWNYSGSGPAQLALAVCLEISPERGEIMYHDFKRKVIAGLPATDFDVEIQMDEYL